jgi:hypothetical protein
MLVWKLIRLKLDELVQDRNLKIFSRYSVIKDPGGVLEIGSLDDEGLSSWKVKNWMREVWSLKQEFFKGQEYLRVNSIMQKQELRFKKGRLVNHKSMNYVDTFFRHVSAYFSFPISSVSRVSPNPAYSFI